VQPTSYTMARWLCPRASRDLNCLLYLRISESGVGCSKQAGQRAAMWSVPVQNALGLRVQRREDLDPDALREVVREPGREHRLRVNVSGNTFSTFSEDKGWLLSAPCRCRCPGRRRPGPVRG
jgi:hypothetical protein